jgi:ribonuclease III
MDQPPLSELEVRLEIQFRRKDLVSLALIHHSSNPGERENQRHASEASNERLEFLGDAVLGAAAAAFVFSAYPEMAEGPLTQIRSALVRRSMVARYADEIELGRFVHVGRAEAGPHGRGATNVQSAAFEALIGAVYLDHGFARTARLLNRFFRRYLPLILEDDLHRNAKSELQEFTQGQFRVTPVYRLVERSGPSHDSRFVAQVDADNLGSARGEGMSLRSAEQAAAHTLLLRLRAQSPPTDDTGSA